MTTPGDRQLRILVETAVGELRARSDSAHDAESLAKWMSSREAPADTSVFDEVVATLRSDAELEVFDDRYMPVFNTAVRFNYPTLATWLILRAQDVGAEGAIADLRRFVQEEGFLCRQILVLGGVLIEEPIDLGEGVKIVPLSDLPRNFNTLALERTSSIAPFMTPTVALVREVRHPRLHVSSSEGRVSPVESPPFQPLRDARLVLTLAGPSGSSVYGMWHEPDPSVPYHPLGMGHRGPMVVEYHPERELTTDDLLGIRDLHSRFCTLEKKVKNRLRLALNRLNSAMRRGDGVDAATDLGIAMEAVFLSDLSDDRGELTFRLSVRAAFLLDRVLEDPRRKIYRRFRDLYRLRSKAVHTGIVDARDGDLLQQGFKDVATAISSLILDPVAKWDDVVFGVD